MPKYLDRQGVAFLWSKITNINKNKLNFYSDTVEGWKSKIHYVAEQNTMYIYIDYKKDEDQDFYIPGIKLGDGKTYLIDLPFLNNINSDIDKQILQHVKNKDIHITSQQRLFWNNKLNLTMDNENLVFNRL